MLQLFLLYVRIKAKEANDRTPVKVANPLSNLVQSQLESQDAVVKNLASSFLNSESTVLEYDLKQAKSMQNGLLINMCFMWFLHFKLQQIQPLLVQTASGLLNLAYSPLFQVYILGRNLERPFKNPAMKRFDELKAQQAQAQEEAQSDGASNEETDESKSDDNGDKEEKGDGADGTGTEVTEGDDASDDSSSSNDEDWIISTSQLWHVAMNGAPKANHISNEFPHQQPQGCTAFGPIPWTAINDFVC